MIKIEREYGHFEVINYACQWDRKIAVWPPKIIFIDSHFHAYMIWLQSLVAIFFLEKIKCASCLGLLCIEN